MTDSWLTIGRVRAVMSSYHKVKAPNKDNFDKNDFFSKHKLPLVLIGVAGIGIIYLATSKKKSKR